MTDEPDPGYVRFRLNAVANLGAGLRTIRTGRGLSQEQLAQAAGIAVLTYGNLERGRSPAGVENPTLDTLLRVFHALELDATALISETLTPMLQARMSPCRCR